ncbi:MAG: hypothetical protein IJI12_00400, partial [Atopobiaceae bacterium]|nr:hypothetical protein [Atopobiaceae bacterium]
ALHLGLSTKERLLDFIAAQDKRVHGREQALTTMSHADTLAESGGESIARATIIEQGFMLPELQHVLRDITDSSVTYRVDFWWETEGQQPIIGELDGHDKYVVPTMTNGKSIVEIMSNERLRESRVSGSGAKVMRFSYADVINTEYFVHLLDSFGVPRVEKDGAVDARLSISEVRFLEMARDEALRYWNLYTGMQAYQPRDGLGH